MKYIITNQQLTVREMLPPGLCHGVMYQHLRRSDCLHHQGTLILVYMVPSQIFISVRNEDHKPRD